MQVRVRKCQQCPIAGKCRGELALHFHTRKFQFWCSDLLAFSEYNGVVLM